MKYRPEIDGLRAFAIIPVILYHAGFQLFGGGYVGVDVFFVISGYLITSIIVAELEKGPFSLVHFYERRARRILPALFAMLFISLPFAWYWLLPDAMVSFSESLIAVSIFVSNIYFWQTSGYFEAAAELKPLIHTWSLAVEEQYYVLFPLFLILSWKLGKRWIVGLLIIVFVVSLACAQWLSIKRPSFAFFLLPTRGWELLIGAFVAFYYSNHNIKKHNHRIEQLGSLLGLSLITYAVFAYSNQTPFPSVYTLVPTLGTALIIIFAGSGTLVGKLLSSRPLVGIGLISYGAYLWHQPMFAFARQRVLGQPSMHLILGLAVLSFAFAYMSWKYIERPFRNKHRISQKNVFVYGAICSALFVGLGFAGTLNNGYKDRFPQEARLFIERPSFESWLEAIRAGQCVIRDGKSTRHANTCHETKRPLIAIWGDSHASALYPGLKKLQFNNNFGITQLTEFKCPPMDMDINSLCKTINENNLADLSKNAPDVLILHSAWSDYNYSQEQIRKKLIKLFHDIRSAMPRTKIIILGPVPKWRESAQQESYLYWLENKFPVPARLKAILNNDTESVLKEIASQNNIEYISAIDALCDSDGCIARLGDAIDDFVQIDNGHLSKAGSEYLIDKIKEEIFKPLK